MFLSVSSSSSSPLLSPSGTASSAAASAPAMLPMSSVAAHSTKDDCWIVIDGVVYDITKFLPDHPGGSQILLSVAGKDATLPFYGIHSKSVLSMLPPEAAVGQVDPSTIQPQQKASVEKKKKANLPPTSVAVSNSSSSSFASSSSAVTAYEKPPLSHFLNVFDFEVVAREEMSDEGWAYYASAADDEVTMRENRSAFHRIFLRPRVLVDVSKLDSSTTFLGTRTSFPLYISACALAKLAHPLGETGLAIGAGRQNIIQMCPTLASCSLEEMCAARLAGQTQWFQLYVNSDRKVTEQLVKKAEKLGCKALAITVDAPMLGRRERDMRYKFTAEQPNVQKSGSTAVNREGGTARAISGWIDPSLSWKDIEWFTQITNMSIVLKGVQCAEDAIRAAQTPGVRGIVVSNHGGRQLDYSRSGIEMLAEIVSALKAEGLYERLEIYVDGGIRRGTDIFKALALGARGVGIGRPSLWGLAAYGAEGVERVIQVLKDEFSFVMTMMGCQNVSQIRPTVLDVRSLNAHIATVPRDYLPYNNYRPLPTAISKL